MDFTIIGPIREIRTIAVGHGIRELRRLVRTHGPARWRKCAGTAWIRLGDGSTYPAELHWYEAVGIGQREFKIKRILPYDL